MNSRLLLLCSGQGQQHAGMFTMLRDDRHAAAIRDLCRSELDAVSAEPEHLFINQFAQPLIAASQMAVWETIKNKVPKPSLVAGYSIGELSAYGIAGMLNAEQVIGLARQRAQFMDACRDPQQEQIMLAVNGIHLSHAKSMIERYGFEIAIVNGDDAFIAGGVRDQLIALEVELTAHGGKLQRLPVHIASHTSWMNNALAPFYERLDSSQFHAGICPVISGKDGTQIHDKQSALTQLSHQLVETIYWRDCMDAFAENGISIALELGPGTALSKMLQARQPQITCRSISEFRSIDGVTHWLSRHFE
ncbi:acyltransferase domain-containing protein [Undibacterium sp. Jales W-56]|uniref:acyltransferase domain-containing protein n=1 Tax=Undibacterium sp. Jales W-56 TaxID=2897325 RepID=UPI0021D086A3|nr:acyltransferase domain-containing protein [Undibacterium sp. Jales W-56]MCU6434501.1 acyltransferase domain-containing protein [Undibacterium sp. Jales W-56]